jgi:hypothetical protein
MEEAEEERGQNQWEEEEQVEPSSCTARRVIALHVALKRIQFETKLMK